MLSVGDVVQIGQRRYIVESGRAGIISCSKCQMRNCHENEDFSFFKKENGALTCGDLLKVNQFFKEIEDDDY